VEISPYPFQETQEKGKLGQPSMCLFIWFWYICYYGWYTRKFARLGNLAYYYICYSHNIGKMGITCYKLLILRQIHGNLKSR